MKLFIFSEITHFYYCLLIAIKLNKKNSSSHGGVSTNLFVIRWLEKSKEYHENRPFIQSEITWLNIYLREKGPLFSFTEQVIANIYNTCAEELRKRGHHRTKPGNTLKFQW